MRNRLIYGIFLLFTLSAGAQTWNPVGTGISGASVNTTWSLYKYDSVLYAGGWFNNAGGTNVNDIAQWNGNSWASVGSGSSGYISAMINYNGVLYAGGFFNNIGGTKASNIATWNGSTWMPAGTGLPGVDYGVYSMAIYNGILYAGGSFDSAGGKYVYGIARWDGTNWLKVGKGIYAADAEDGIYALAIYNGDLYVAGEFDSAGGLSLTSSVAKWDGTNWSVLAGVTNKPIFALAVYKGNLYAGGLFDTIGGIPASRIAMWNGTTWSPIGLGLTGESDAASVNSLVVFNGGLYIGGYFDSANGKPANSIVEWDGTNWSTLGSGINKSGAISAMAVYDSALYIGGGFDSAGGVYAHNIAMWTNPSAIDEYSANNNISVYPNPSNGVFTVEEQGVRNKQQTINIYNVLGEKVYSISCMIQNFPFTINLSTQATGLYLYRIISEKGAPVATGKLIIR